MSFMKCKLLGVFVISDVGKTRLSGGICSIKAPLSLSKLFAPLKLDQECFLFFLFFSLASWLLF